MLLGHHRVVERVVLIVELDDRAGQLRALFDAEALGQGAGRDIAHDDFERDDFHFADELLPHVQPADEVGRARRCCSDFERRYSGDPVVEHALPVDHLVLLRVEGRGVVLEVLNQSAGLGALIENLGLAFVDAAAAIHWDQPGLEVSPWGAVAPCITS